MKLLRNQTLHGIGAHAHLPVSFGVRPEKVEAAIYGI